MMATPSRYRPHSCNERSADVRSQCMPSTARRRVPLPRKQGSTFYVRFQNGIDEPGDDPLARRATEERVRWLARDDAAPVAPGATFVYAVHCPDAGIFWYHDHVREDIGHPMGLYGNISSSRARRPRTRAGAQRVPHPERSAASTGTASCRSGSEAPNFALMGRFGNVLLINGEPRWHCMPRRVKSCGSSSPTPPAHARSTSVSATRPSS